MDDNHQEIMRKASIAQEMLGRVIHTTDNLDEKVGRIFSSMSFLALAATAFYTAFVTDRVFVKVSGIDLISVLFVGFMICVAASTALMLEAMGPRVHLNPWRAKSHETGRPTPTGYADRIASMDRKEWSEYFAKIDIDDLYARWYTEAMEEVYILSKKVDRKAAEMRNAQRTFLMAIIFLVLMVLLGASSFF